MLLTFNPALVAEVRPGLGAAAACGSWLGLPAEAASCKPLGGGSAGKVVLAGRVEGVFWGALQERPEFVGVRHQMWRGPDAGLCR